MSTARSDGATSVRSGLGARPRAWSDLRLRGKGAVLVAIPLFVFAIASGLFVFTLSNDTDAGHRIRQSEVIERQLAAVDRAIGAWQSAERGYLVLGDAENLAAARADKAQLTSTIDSLAALVGNDQAQLKRVDALRQSVDAVPPLPTSATSGAPGGDAVRTWISLDNAQTAMQVSVVG